MSESIRILNHRQIASNATDTEAFIDCRTLSTKERYTVITLVFLAIIPIVTAIVSLTTSGFIWPVAAAIWIGLGSGIIAITLIPLAIRHNRFVKEIKEEIRAQGGIQQEIDEINRLKAMRLPEGEECVKRYSHVREGVIVLYSRKKKGEESRIIYPFSLSLEKEIMGQKKADSKWLLTET